MSETADIIIRDGTIITMNDTRTVIREGSIAIRDGIILDVDKTWKVDAKYKSENIINAKKSLVIPGLINCHTHLFQSLFRGLGTEMPVEEWVDKVIFPLSRYLGEEESYVAAKLSLLEMIKTGTTTLADSHYIHVDKNSIYGIARAVEESGMRALLARASQDIFDPEPFLEDLSTTKKETRRFFRDYNGKANGRIHVCPEVLSPIEGSENFILGMWELASELGTGLHLHVAETIDEVKLIRIKTGLGEVEYLDSLGVLDKDVLLAHVIWISDKELSIIKNRKAKIAHNPVSNQFLGDGIAMVPIMRMLGITVGIGTDGAASNNNLDMIEAMKTCALMYKLWRLDPRIISAEKVLEMATVEGARALRMNDIGSLEIGKKADIVIINLDDANLTPSLKRVPNYIYSMRGNNVSTVLIDGKVVMENHEVKTLDEKEILDAANSTAIELMSKSDINFEKNFEWKHL